MKTRPQLRQRLLGPALALASTFLGLAAIETWARLSEASRVARLREQQRAEPTARFHPLLGWEKVPGGLRRSQVCGVDATFGYNSHGLRGPERGYDRPAGTRRVLVLGDSFAEGYYAREENTLRAVLERRLAEGGCGPCEVLNGGTAGYSTDQAYLFYREQGRRYGAQVVLLTFYYASPIQSTTATTNSGAAKPLFAIDGDALRLTNTPLAPPETLTREQRVSRVRARQPWCGSVALSLLGSRTSAANPQLNHVLARLGLVPASDRTPPDQMTIFGAGPRVEEAWRLTRILLRDLKSAVEADGARLVVLYVPAAFEIEERELTLTRARYQFGGRWNPSRVITRLRGICGELRLPLADPREALRRATASGGTQYCGWDFHWNEAGHRAAAEVATPLVRTALGCGEAHARP